MQTPLQQQDETGLIGRLKQVLGQPNGSTYPSAGLRAEDLPGFYLQVAPDGVILQTSRTLAEMLGGGDQADLRGRSIDTYLPAVAPGSPLCREIWEKGEVRNVRVRLFAPIEGTYSTARLSARADTRAGMAPGAWIGCLTLSCADDRHLSLPAGIDWELLDGLRSEMQAQLENLSLHVPPGDSSDAPVSLGSMLRTYMVFLPRLDALLALNTLFSPQSFDARASVAGLCRSSGRLLSCAGVNLVFDADPRFPDEVTTDEKRLLTCLNLLLGAISTTEDPKEIVVHLAFEDSCYINIQIVVWPANPRPALNEQRARQMELSKTLAATVDGVVSVSLEPSDCRQYALRVKAPAASEPDVANESDVAANEAGNWNLQGLRILHVGPGQNLRTVFAKWVERQQSRFLHTADPWDTQQACSSVRPDVAVLDLSACPVLPDFLRGVPVLGLRGTLAPPPEWCRTFIEKPVFEEELLDAISSLRPRITPADWESLTPADPITARVLAVDDNPVNQRIIQKMLLRLGYEVDIASNGLEALSVLQQRPHDAILMDWEMPIMDGLEATAAIRELPEPLCRIPIIAVTAHAVPGDREACLRGGMDDYLGKPVNVDVLRRSLEKWLPNSPRLSRREE